MWWFVYFAASWAFTGRTPGMAWLATLGSVPTGRQRQ